MNAIECKDISKSFQGKKALEHVSFAIEEGSICALIGRNGAGKTTLMNCLCTKYLPDEGEIRILEEPAYENERVLEEICFMSDYLDAFSLKSIRGILRFASTFYKKWDDSLMKRMLDFFEISMKDSYESLSKGKQTATGIIIGLCSGCSVTLLDEIYSGLDAAARRNLYEILLEVQEESARTFLLSTHLIEEMTGLFTEAMILDKGQVVLKEDIETIYRKSCRCSGRCDRASFLEHKNIIGRKEMGTIGTYDIYDEFTQAERKKLEEEGFTLSALSLQDMFLSLTSGGTKEWGNMYGTS